VQFHSSEITDRLRGSLILDTLSRADYSMLPHLAGGVNIPSDELNARMQFDLPSHDTRIIIDCSAAEETTCRGDAIMLSWGGFENVWIYDLGAQGVTCEATPSAQ